MTQRIPLPIRYSGGKSTLAQWIVSFMPKHTVYVEPFAGGGSVFFSKPPSELEVINDLNGDIVNFFRVLRERGDELIEVIKNTPYSREEWRAAHNLDIADPLERARRLFILSWQSYGSYGGGKKNGWRTTKSVGFSTPVENWGNLRRLELARDRLKMACNE